MLALGANKTSIILAVVSFLALGVQSGFAEVVSVDPIVEGRAFSSDKTKTFLWAAKDAKATLVFIPGGTGRIGLVDDKKDLGSFDGSTLKPLADPRLTQGLVNVVVFDSPSVLSEGKYYPNERATADHMARIESVVLFYKEKLSQPIWLMGHSNGAVSVTEFYKYLQKANREPLVSGMVYSSGRTGSDFNPRTTNLPVLFLAHEMDECLGSPSAASRAVYERLKRVDTAKLEYVLIRGGSSQADPCRSGYHMFYGASAEAYKAIDAFISSFYR